MRDVCPKFVADTRMRGKQYATGMPLNIWGGENACDLFDVNLLAYILKCLETFLVQDRGKLCDPIQARTDVEQAGGDFRCGIRRQIVAECRSFRYNRACSKLSDNMQELLEDCGDTLYLAERNHKSTAT